MQKSYFSRWLHLHLLCKEQKRMPKSYASNLTCYNCKNTGCSESVNIPSSQTKSWYTVDNVKISVLPLSHVLLYMSNCWRYCLSGCLIFFFESMQSKSPVPPATSHSPSHLWASPPPSSLAWSIKNKTQFVSVYRWPDNVTGALQSCSRQELALKLSPHYSFSWQHLHIMIALQSTFRGFLTLT